MAKIQKTVTELKAAGMGNPRDNSQVESDTNHHEILLHC